ncbi:MAG TPA: MFS transporter [Burkholderiales bacterium]
MTDRSNTRLPRTVYALGLVSFLNDVASDIVIPLIPIVLATVLAAGPVALGLVEGVADAVASFLRLWAGRHSDVTLGRRKPLVIAGYALSNLARPLLALAGGWVTVLILRSIDRVGKGIRSAPRDAWVADVAPRELTGKAFGVHRAFDNAGAVGGGLLAAAAIAYAGTSLHNDILYSAIPGVLCLLLIAIVRDALQRSAPEKLPPLRWSVLSGGMRRYLLVLGAFTFARVSETFLVLYGHGLGMSVVELLLLWSALNAMKSAGAYAGGVVSDRVGRKAVMLTSWIGFAAAYYFVCATSTAGGLWTVTLFYGALEGLSEGAERALIKEFGREGEQGTAFGWYHLLVGIAAIPAGAIFGALWQLESAAIAFSFAGAVAAASALLLAFWVKPRASRATIPGS